eukprot:Pgem_evm4s8972
MNFDPSVSRTRGAVPVPSDVNLIKEGLAALAKAQDVYTPKTNTYVQAMSCDDSLSWEQAIKAEKDYHYKNDTMVFSALPPGRKAIGVRWVFKVKADDLGNIQRYKARLCAKGYTMEPYQDYDPNIYAPVAKMKTIRLFLALAAAHGMKVHQCDVDGAFTIPRLKEEVYMKIPPGYDAPHGANCVLLQASIPGLKQSNHVWNVLIDSDIKEFGFKQSSYDPCLYWCHCDGSLFLLTLWTDDLLLACANVAIIHKFEDFLAAKHDIKRLGLAKWILGINVQQGAGFIKLNQSKYIQDILTRFRMNDSKPVRTTGFEQSGDVSAPLTHELFRAVVGCLLYLSLVTRGDIAFSVNKLARKSSAPTEQDWTSAKHLLRYLIGTVDYSLLYKKQDTINYSTAITAMCDSDYAGCSETRRSTSGYVFLVFGVAFIWFCRRQKAVTLSSMEAEIMAICDAVKEIIWVRNLMSEVFNCSIIST